MLLLQCHLALPNSALIGEFLSLEMTGILSSGMLFLPFFKSRTSSASTRMRQWPAQSFLCLAALLINKFMQNDNQAQEANTQKLSLILAPALLYLDQMGPALLYLDQTGPALLYLDQMRRLIVIVQMLKLTGKRRFTIRIIPHIITHSVVLYLKYSPTFNKKHQM